MTNDLRIDFVQGYDDSGLAFGFIYREEGQGGWFFSWCESLAKTLRSIEPCSVEGDGGIDDDEVRDVLRSLLPMSKRGMTMWAPSRDASNYRG